MYPYRSKRPVAVCLTASALLAVTSSGALAGCGGGVRDENYSAPVVQGSDPTLARPVTPKPTANLRDASVGRTPGRDAATTDGGTSVAVGPSTRDAAATPSDVADAAAELPFTKANLLTAAAECALATAEQFLEAAESLAVATDDWDTEELDSAESVRQAFRAAMARLQVLEQFRVGPAARSMDPGGQDLRDTIYSFPLRNRCEIDRNLVNGAYASEYSSLLITARGMDALEYLLFYDGSENACSLGIDINNRGTWDALSQEELMSRRADYARAIAQEVLDQAQLLVNAWRPDRGNFLAELTEAGAGSEVYTSQQQGLNALSHALFYVELEVKDLKLGWPLGLVAECLSGTCPEAAESPYARTSADNIARNLAGFRALYAGCGPGGSGLGFDDWLVAVDPTSDLNERMLSALDGADEAVAQLDRDLEDAFYDAPEEARAVHAAVKRLTDLLKTEFVSVLNLELPKTAEGDND